MRCKPFFISLMISGLTLIGALASDSLRMETRAGKSFVIHEIEQGETLYSLSKRYKTTIQAIIDHNPNLTTDIEIGQTLTIPYAIITLDDKPIPKNENGRKTHLVDIGESVYGISKKYGVEIKDLQQWNQLNTFDINVGQALYVESPKKNQENKVSIPLTNNLISGVVQSTDKGDFHIVMPKETLFGISRKYNMTVEELKSLNQMTTNTLALGQKLSVHTVKKNTEAGVINPSTVKDNATTEDSLTKKPAPSLRFSGYESKERIVEIGGIKKKYEEGFGAKISGQLDTDKYLVLHKSAPLGTIVQIRNLMTKKSVTARVVGKLPDTGNNENILIRLSKITFERLGGIDRNIPVEVSYIP